jgi:hypothetical protein
MHINQRDGAMAFIKGPNHSVSLLPQPLYICSNRLGSRYSWRGACAFTLRFAAGAIKVLETRQASLRGGMSMITDVCWT